MEQPGGAAVRKTPYTGKPTENPQATVVPGKMRSDREEIPEGFTKADADKAETMEARLQQERQARVGLFLTPGCQVFWPAPFEVCGAILDKYNQLGGPQSFLLLPKSNELVNPDGYGRRSEFLGGNIYWSAGTGAHFVAHDFLTKWGQYGYETGFMKYPLTDEIVNPDNVGRRQQFQGGMIYWAPLPGAHTIYGRILEKWGELGYEQGSLGYPISDEMNSTGTWANVSQRQSNFQRGGLFYDGPSNTVLVGYRNNFF